MNWRDNCKILTDDNVHFYVFHPSKILFLGDCESDFPWDAIGTKFESIKSAEKALSKASEPLCNPFIEVQRIKE